MPPANPTVRGQSEGHHRAAWVVSVVLALIFIPSGLMKLLALDQVVAMFQAWGYPMWFMFTIGVLEVFAGALVLVPRVATYAAGYLGIEMLGALVTHIVNAQWLFALLPIVVGTAAMYLMWARLPDAAGSEGVARPTRV